MSMFESPDNILLLQKLLQPQRGDDSSSESDDDVPAAASSKFTPSQIGPKYEPKKVAKRPEEPEPEPKPKPKKNLDIEEWLEEQEKEDGDLLETRQRPEYTIVYKQAVGTEDLFLQMGNKTCASSSCEDMVIEIKLPDETVSVQEMGISVTEKEIDLTTPVYRLKLPLVQRINPDKSSAKYFTETRTLCLTCRMNREYDFVNF